MDNIIGDLKAADEKCSRRCTCSTADSDDWKMFLKGGSDKLYLALCRCCQRWRPFSLNLLRWAIREDAFDRLEKC